ncbi:MAG: PEGA domain-containing protein, partial [Rhodothermales bacterium]
SIADEPISTGPTDRVEEAIIESANILLPELASQELASQQDNVYEQPTKHAFMVRSIPTGATVSIDGKEMGVTPFQLSRVSHNSMRIELALAGYSTLSEDIQLDDDKSTEVFFRLTPNNRPLIISVFPWGNVYVDDQLMAERVSGTDTLMITRENASISVKHPSFGNWEKQLNQQGVGPLAFTIDFRERATLRISAFDEENQPIAGEVIIDGHNTNQVTPIAMELSFGTHNIEIRSSGFETFKFNTTIDAESGQPQPLKVQLKRK